MRGIHHLHRRKRVHHNLESYPHENKWIHSLDKFLIFIAIVGPLIALPQIIQIFAMRSAEGVSSLSWGLYALFNLPWLVYGIVHKDKPIKISYSLSFIANLTVLAGSLIY
ncbi:hypothetical protein HNV12_03370 [Methanococcoides sp. SA1]|nr:hypothetical protein [Methanococcoides sp. SA1]